MFDAALVVDHPAVVAARLDRRVLGDPALSAGLPPLFSGLVGAVRGGARSTPCSAESKSALAQRLPGLTREQQHDLLVELVCSHVAAVLGHSGAADIDPGPAFQDLGFDSLTAVELRNRLKTSTGLPLPPTLIFDYPTPTALADYLRQQLSGSVSRCAGGGARRVGVDEPVAIVGMGCRFPGGVDSAEGLWEVVAGGRDVVSGFPD